MTRTELCNEIAKFYSLDELSELCHSLNIDPETFRKPKQRFIRELVNYCERHGQIEQLLQECENQRPRAEVDWLSYKTRWPTPPPDKIPNVFIIVSGVLLIFFIVALTLYQQTIVDRLSEFFAPTPLSESPIPSTTPLPISTSTEIPASATATSTTVVVTNTVVATRFVVVTATAPPTIVPATSAPITSTAITFPTETSTAVRSDEYEIEVNSYTASNDICVAAGHTVSIRATGSISVGPFVGEVGPGGTTGVFPFYNIVPQIPHAALLCRVQGETDWRKCGSTVTFTAPIAGCLEFEVNDNEQENNDPNDFFTVEVSITNFPAPEE